MKKIIGSILFNIIAVVGFSQSTYFTITGKVMDGTSKATLQSASVFAQNTTMGTVTDSNGVFKLNLPNGGYDLSITYAGYQTETRRITTTNTTDNSLIIELKQANKMLEAVAIVSSNEVKDGLEKYGSFFLENFIGKTPFSKNCVLLNADSLKFYFSKRKNRLKVLCKAPLEIQNNALGYKIKYALDSFTYEYNTQINTYSGSPFFEEMQTTDSLQKQQWQMNRLVAYKGSILHFMRSMFNKSLKEEGFEIQFIAKRSDNDTALMLKDYYEALNYNKVDSTHTVEFYPNQPDVAVLYKNEIPAVEYLAQNEDSPKDFQLSIFNINPSQSVVIEQNGYYYDQNNISITGYLSWEKVADMLPYDYTVLH